MTAVSGWSEVKLGELLSEDRGISVGVMYPGEHDPLCVPLIKAADLADDRIVTPTFRISPKVHYDYRRTALEGGELLMTLVGNVGRVAIAPITMKGWNAARAIAVMRFSDATDARFVRAALQSPRVRHLMDVWSNTTVQQTLNLKEIRQLPLPWPPGRERTGIVAVLGALDDKIELNRRMNETLEQTRARSSSRGSSISIRCAKAEGRQPSGMDAETAALFPSELVESGVGRIPSGWQAMPLDVIAQFRNGLALQNFRPRDGEAALPVVKIAQLRTGESDSGEWSRADIDPSCVLVDGDMIFSWSGSLAVVIWCGGRAALNQHLFRVTSEHFPKWFVQWLLAHLLDFQAIASGKATTMGHIQRHHLTAATCVIAPPNVIEAASRACDPLLQRYVCNELESRSLRRMRDALLPKLLSGEIRVRGAERIASAMM